MERRTESISSRGLLIPREPLARAIEARIHPTAVIDSEAELGDGCRIGPGAVVGAEVRLGARVTVGANAVLTGPLEVGEDTRIFPGAVLGEEPQDLHFTGAPSRLVIGRRCQIREAATVHRATRPGGSTVVEDDVLLMATSHVAHDCRVREGAILANGVLLAGHVDVGRQAILSGNAVVHQFVRIGTLAMIGGASRVNRDVPPFAMLVGDSRLRGLNRIGLVRAGHPRDVREELYALYRLLRNASPTLAKALPELRERGRSSLARELADFLEEPSRRGFCRF